MKIVVVLLVVLIAVNFSIAANKDSPKAKKAQNQCKAIVKKLKSKANGQKNELKGKLVASSNKYTAELKKTMSSVSAAFKPLGNQGQALADVFKGNVSIYVNTFNFLLNSKSIDAILLLTLEQLKYTYIDPIQADIHNLTLQINNKTSAYTCFETRMKSLKTIGENVIVQTKPIVLKAEATVKSNISIIIASIESIRTTAVKTLKACKGNEACGVKYVNTYFR